MCMICSRWHMLMGKQVLTLSLSCSLGLTLGKFGSTSVICSKRRSREGERGGGSAFEKEKD